MTSISRRKFLSATGLTTAAMLTHPWESYSQPLATRAAAGYSVLILATNWGFGGSTEAFFQKVKAEGYDGVEVWYPTEVKAKEELLALAKTYDLKFGFLVGGSDKDFKNHFSVFENNLAGAAQLRPLYINCHSGRDYFTFEENSKFIEMGARVAAQSGVPVYHETHRSRMMYAAPATRQYINQFPALRLTLDVSHWCNVHESLLQDQEETMQLVLTRTEHIHARVGHPEGPQVNDPRAPEWEQAVGAHFAWWDKIAERKKKEGKRLTLLTEFGPVNYMPALPYTRQPLANQWEINVHMKQTLRKRYS